MTLVAFVAVNGADALLTALSIGVLGAQELNPFLAAIAWNDGIEKMLLVKILLSVAIGGALWQRGAIRTLRLLNWSMAGIVMYNGILITHVLT
jgi:hypothetical protein